MTMASLCCLLVFLIAAAEATGVRRSSDGGEVKLRRDDFPKDFVFGAGTSAYQWEGATTEDGRTRSIWDTFCHRGKVIGGSTGDISSDGYHKYKEDVELMAEAGIEAYRFSISWSRLLPNGRGTVNPLGLQFYNSLIDELISHGIQPHVTLLHYDYPQVLEDEYGGWLSLKIVDDFTEFADVCFKEFGDRVLFWTTLNEPNIFAIGGYDQGSLPPQRCSYPFGINCTVGNSVSEPYIVAHNMLLSHTSVASLYRSKFQEKQKGFIGLNILAFYFLPLTNSTKATRATERAFDFYVGWFVEPLVHGDYPESMKRIVGKKLPSFSMQQKKQITNSFDFLGLNYYFTVWIDDVDNVVMKERDFMHATSVKISVKEGPTPANKFNSFGLKGLLEYFKLVYGNPPVYIHENGYAMPHDTMLEDNPRVEFISAHIESLRDALRNGSNVRGYIAWSLVDVFELLSGYQQSFGLYYIDFADKDLKRIPKLSARWYSDFLKRKGDPFKNNIHLPTSLSRNQLVT